MQLRISTLFDDTDNSHSSSYRMKNPMNQFPEQQETQKNDFLFLVLHGIHWKGKKVWSSKSADRELHASCAQKYKQIQKTVLKCEYIEANGRKY